MISIESIPVVAKNVRVTVLPASQLIDQESENHKSIRRDERKRWHTQKAGHLLYSRLI